MPPSPVSGSDTVPAVQICQRAPRVALAFPAARLSLWAADAVFGIGDREARVVGS
jgi:hypothetical protein